ncbi:tetratricopeptide repeat protein [Arenimonas donghaensis]|uniref:protein O-GlcNAc transferase n=1 Tax=Arenimonas donghaensis DSM 18148 = HO3-R19 TaxID=1121014 RepID=A0A087MI11_9GAMM|nr:glycosyltransferase family 41 protein [Arenimonas donghaensis]KFL36514.1 hypothetical protein N788_12840 [Arenimonas donghaensis DSM 18148 = HO3-R19]
MMPPAASPEVLFVQATQAFRQGQAATAWRLVQALLARSPRHADGWNLAGILAQTRGDVPQALECFKRALAAGASPGVLVNVGFAHQKLGDNDAAMTAYRQAVRAQPGLAIAWQKLGGLNEAKGETTHALAAYRRAVQADRDDLRSLCDGLYLRRHLGDWAADPVLDPQTLLAAFARAKRSDGSPSILLSLPEASPRAQREAAALFARSQWGPLLDAPPLAVNARPGDRRLRIGYLSADFSNHAVSYLVAEVLAAHDREAVEVFAYGYRAPAPGDPWRTRIRAAVDTFVDIDAMDDAAAASRIHADGIDVLVDLTGYTQGGRPGINARRPAPVIAQWIGYIGTLGEPRLADYVIGDAVAIPTSLEPAFSEAVARLPGCFQPNGALAPVPAPPSRADAGLPGEGVVFCSFNQTYKMNPAVWDDWCAVLAAVPGSVLWLATGRHASAHAHLRAEAERRGIDGGRLVFAPQLSREAHLARLALADLALDTYPYNSGTTASDALRMGVPVLSFAGDTFVSRMAASLLHAAGLEDCLAKDRAGLVALAIRLGLDDTARMELKTRLRARLDQGRLFDPAGFARDLERLLATMHAQALAGTRESFTLAADPADCGPRLRRD